MNTQPTRHLSDITDEEIKDVCLLSGEVLYNFILEKIVRNKDPEDNIRFIEAHCKSVYSDGSFSLKQIHLNTHGIVWVVDLKREPCDNICRRDVIIGQYEVLFYFMRKGFDFPEQRQNVDLFLSDREKWLHRHDMREY
jgi:hypothetical protein